jgi:hypothetical protein
MIRARIGLVQLVHKCSAVVNAIPLASTLSVVASYRLGMYFVFVLSSPRRMSMSIYCTGKGLWWERKELPVPERDSSLICWHLLCTGTTYPVLRSP